MGGLARMSDLLDKAVAVVESAVAVVESAGAAAAEGETVEASSPPIESAVTPEVDAAPASQPAEVALGSSSSMAQGKEADTGFVTLEHEGVTWYHKDAVHSLQEASKVQATEQQEALKVLQDQVESLQKQLEEANQQPNAPAKPKPAAPRRVEAPAAPVSRVEQARLRAEEQERNQLNLDTPDTRAYYENKEKVEPQEKSFLGWLF